jgi:hypothetical protein
MSSTENGQAIAELAVLREDPVGQVGRTIQLHEPQLVLNLASRRSSEVRMFKHIQQLSLLHRENFAASNQIKHLYLVDGFLAMAAAQNPVALYGLARSMFELSAFLHEIRKRLNEVVVQVNDKTWLPLGEKFFGLIVRARFATTHPKYVEMLRADGVPESRLKPFHITNCIQNLAKQPEHADAIERYGLLCDFVHHNLGSSTLANSGSAVSKWARTPGGGGTIWDNDTATVTQYEYPVEDKGHRAVDDLASGFLQDTRACIGWINLIPESPFPPAMVMEMTGTQFGMPWIRPPST